MPTRTPRTPKYCLQRSTGRAYCRIDGQWINLGKYDTPESHDEYDRLLATWLSNHRRLPSRQLDENEGATVAELLAAYWRFAQEYYRNVTHQPSA